jgi:hypothetical protein
VHLTQFEENRLNIALRKRSEMTEYLHTIEAQQFFRVDPICHLRLSSRQIPKFSRVPHNAMLPHRLHSTKYPRLVSTTIITLDWQVDRDWVERLPFLLVVVDGVGGRATSAPALNSNNLKVESAKVHAM